MEMYGLIVHTFLVCSYILRQEIKYVFTVVMAACLTCRSYRELIFQYLSLPFKSLALNDFTNLFERTHVLAKASDQ